MASRIDEREKAFHEAVIKSNDQKAQGSSNHVFFVTLKGVVNFVGVFQNVIKFWKHYMNMIHKHPLDLPTPPLNCHKHRTYFFLFFPLSHPLRGSHYF